MKEGISAASIAVDQHEGGQVFEAPTIDLVTDGMEEVGVSNPPCQPQLTPPPCNPRLPGGPPPGG